MYQENQSLYPLDRDLPIGGAIHLLQYWGLEKIAYVAGVERGRGLEGWKKKEGGLHGGKEVVA